MSARNSRTFARAPRRGRADVAVDVHAVGLDAERKHFRAQLPQRFGRHLVSGAVGAIDHDAHALERHVARQSVLGEFDIARAHVIDAAGAAQRGGLGQFRAEIGLDQSLDLAFDLVRQLEALRTEQFDAVVLEQIMRGGNHHAEIGAHRAGQHGHGRRRHRAEQQHVHADGGEAGDQGIFDHVAGKPGVLADHHAVAIVAVLEHKTSRLSDFHRQIRRDTLFARPRMPSVPKNLRLI